MEKKQKRNIYSLITTVNNEERSIEEFLKSVDNQTQRVDEVIIVDAGSTDRTRDIISNFRFSKIRQKVMLFVKKGNRSVGRNEAIKRSSGNIILCSDIGCRLDKKWVENITRPFKKEKVDVVAGFYKPLTRNVFEKCLSAYTSVMDDQLNVSTYIPSSRSIAFRKQAWKKVGGYPKHLSYCEDLVFAKKLKEKGFRFITIPKAFVYWRQRSNFLQAFKQFFLYAMGDGRAHYFREATPFLFIRYFIFFYTLIYGVIVKSLLWTLFIAACTSGYIIWSIYKNYKYVNDKRAFFYLPALQLVSDLAVLFGTSLGLLQSIKDINFKSLLLKNKGLITILLIYIGILLSQLNFGLPNESHPFPYHMDEWHQMQAVRAVFKHGTPNIEGAAHGTMFHFFISGILLLPFTVVGYINPFAVGSAVDNLWMQERIFQVLRLNTLLFGIGSIIILIKIIKDYLKINPLYPALLFVFSPIFLVLSNYFKYDIALVFWILASIMLAFAYIKNSTLHNLMLFSFVSALAISAKVSALPLLGSLIALFFIGTQQKKSLLWLLIGIAVFIFMFILFGIPDSLVGKGNILKYLNDNLLVFPAGTSNFNLSTNYAYYLIFIQFPLLFGYSLYTLSFLGILVMVIKIIRRKINRYELFILLTLAIFILSLIPLKITAGGNRAIVLLPTLALIGGIFFTSLQKKVSSRSVFYVFVLCFALSLQVLSTLVWLSVRTWIDPRQKSSFWITKNIPQLTQLGMEVPPLYQNVPDILLLEYYKKQYHPSYQTHYNYVDIDESTLKYPDVVLVSNAEIHKVLFKTSSKKTIAKRLEELGYKQVAYFSPQLSLFRFFSDETNFYLSGISATPNSIEIYSKRKY